MGGRMSQRAGDMKVTVGHRVGTNGLYYEVRVPVPREGNIAEAVVCGDVASSETAVAHNTARRA